jgi:ribosomal protein L19E
MEGNGVRADSGEMARRLRDRHSRSVNEWRRGCGSRSCPSKARYPGTMEQSVDDISRETNIVSSTVK